MLAVPIEVVCGNDSIKEAETNENVAVPGLVYNKMSTGHHTSTKLRQTTSALNEQYATKWHQQKQWREKLHHHQLETVTKTDISIQNEQDFFEYKNMFCQL